MRALTAQTHSHKLYFFSWFTLYCATLDVFVCSIASLCQRQALFFIAALWIERVHCAHICTTSFKRNCWQKVCLCVSSAVQCMCFISEKDCIYFLAICLVVHGYMTKRHAFAVMLTAPSNYYKMQCNHLSTPKNILANSAHMWVWERIVHFPYMCTYKIFDYYNVLCCVCVSW